MQQEKNKNTSSIIPELVSGSSTHAVSEQTQQSSKTLKQVQGLPNLNNSLICPRVKTLRDDERFRAFTLIELLVVVLIIAILAAIAVPQYQKVVEKSKATEAITLLKSLQQAQQAYYMIHGTYTTKFDDLDIQFPWTGNTKFLNKNIDTKSNKDWSAQIEPYQSHFNIFVMRISGKYKGAGFGVEFLDAQPQITCRERKKTANYIFNSSLGTGAYCEKIIHGTYLLSSEWERVYTLPH